MKMFIEKFWIYKFLTVLLCTGVFAQSGTDVIENAPIKSIEYSKDSIIGSIQRIESFPSRFVRPRNVDIWLPEGYSKDKKYAVLYMHDGQMLFDSESTWNKQEWGVDETLNDLIIEDMVKPTIVVGIWHHSDIRMTDYFPQKPFEYINVKDLDQKEKEFKDSVESDNYLKFIVEELKPYVDTHFSTLTDVANTFIGGSSMGGLISMYAICEYPKVFSGAICMSTHWIGLGNPDTKYANAFYAYLEENLPSPDGHRFYFDYGTETLDKEYIPHQEGLDRTFYKAGFQDVVYVNRRYDGHDHSEASWRKRLDVPIRFLLGKTQKK